MAWAAVGGQHCHGLNGAGNPTATMPGAVSVGNRITVITEVFRSGATPTAALADNLGNTYTEHTFGTYNDGGFQSRFSQWSTVVTTGGTPTFTLTTQSGGAISAQEYSGTFGTGGAGGVDVALSATASAPTASVTTATTTAANELVVGGYTDDGNNIALTGKNGTGFTERDVNGSSGISESYLEDKDSGAVGTQTANMSSGTPAAGFWGMVATVYLNAAGGGGGGGLPFFMQSELLAGGMQELAGARQW